MIESDDTSVLSKFKGVPSYDKILTIDELIGGAPKQSIDEIKKFANSVNIARSSVMITQMGFTKSTSPVIDQLQAANVTIYLGVFINEYTTLGLDFYSDPIVELSTYGLVFGLNGVITDYPSTASEFKIHVSTLMLRSRLLLLYPVISSTKCFHRDRCRLVKLLNRNLNQLMLSTRLYHQ